ncbi:glycosyltransferase [Propionivibrio limicola]|uniref:glycosyltransferase n=1 Tax=Propionivibrio limicola TaxID=167645 RepID=UPI001B88213E|nr:glycosyltransferase [Propionivibrio limicola]
MRVAMVSDVYFPRINGVSTAIRTYRESLRAQGVEVRLIAPDYGTECHEDWIARVPGRRVPFDPEDRLVRWGAMHRAVEEVVKSGCDLIHVQTPFAAHYAGTAAAKRYDVPVIATYHTLFEEYLAHYAKFVPASWLRGLARNFSRRQCNELDAVIVPSKAIWERLAEYYVATPMHILPTGVSIGEAAPDARASFRARHHIAPERPVALYVGRVAHEKNIDFLLDVADLMRESVPEMLLVIAGEGPALPHLQRSVVERGLQQSVSFIGYLDRQTELPACYAAADAFVFASRTETQGLVLLEAMACGLPVVALAEMGTADILGAQRGALVPDDNPYAFSLALTRLLRDSALHQRLSSEARDYAREWSSDALAARMAGLYRQILSAHLDRRVRDFKLSPL